MPEFNPGGAADLDHAVKLRYEANPDTNAFGDADKAKLDGIATGATANAPDAALRDRAGHTGTQPVASVEGLAAALDARPLSEPTGIAGAGSISNIVTLSAAAYAALAAPDAATLYIVTEA